MLKSIIILCIILANGNTDEITDSIAEVINRYVKDLSNNDIRQNILHHYRLLGLIDANGQWVHHDLKRLSSSLTPR